MKRNPTFERLVREIPPETKARVEKAMTCAYYYNGGDCRKGLPGTTCDPEGCVAWKRHKDFKHLDLRDNGAER